MKIDAYVILLEHPSRFGLKIGMGWGEYAGAYLRVVALPEMTESQVLRLALDNISYLLERLRAAGVTVNVHRDDPPEGFRGGYKPVRFGDGDDELLLGSTDRLKALLATPKDLRFKRTPNGAAMI